MSTHDRTAAGGRARRVALGAALCAAVVGSSATAWATTTGPTPVKASPSVSETAPAARGPWFGWSQNRSQRLGHYDFYVQRGDANRVRVNPSGTEGLGGDVVAGRVVYAEQHGDRFLTKRVLLRVFDPATGTRTSLPDRVNEWRHRGAYPHPGDPKIPLLRLVRGDVSASGPWVLYSGLERRLEGDDYDLDTVMLYNRTTGELRQLRSTYPDYEEADAGQVNGGWVAYRYQTFHREGGGGSRVVRYEVATGERQSVGSPAYPGGKSTPAVSSDGTVYYMQVESGCGDRCRVLYRWPVGGTPVAIATTTYTPTSGGSAGLRVQDLADGRRAILFGSEAVEEDDADGNIYEYVDDPSTPTTVARN